MADIYEIQPTDCIGNSRAQINTNFNNLNLDVTEIKDITEDLRSKVTTLSAMEQATKKYVGDASFYNESTFVYGFSNIKRPVSLENRWADVFTNVYRDPLKIEIQIDEGPKAAIIEGRIILRHGVSNTSAWLRMARFDDMAAEAEAKEVLDISTSEGTHIVSCGNAVNLSKVVILQPGVKYIFGLQTYFWVSRATEFQQSFKTGKWLEGDKLKIWEKKSFASHNNQEFQVLDIKELWMALALWRQSQYSGVIVNGWSADTDNANEQLKNTYNPYTLTDVQATNKYLNDGKSGLNRIGKATKYGYAYDEQEIEKGVKNVSYIRATVI